MVKFIKNIFSKNDDFKTQNKIFTDKIASELGGTISIEKKEGEKESLTVYRGKDGIVDVWSETNEYWIRL